jgi:Cd2+/Zn2+-exporting ATPase/Cu+-exporting ATPase
MSEDRRALEPLETARIAGVAVAAAVVWFAPFDARYLGIAATLIGGFPIFKEAFENLLARRMTMELSMTIALVAALAIGETFTALVITAFVLAAEVLEELTVARGRTAIADLLDVLPRRSRVRRGGAVVEIATGEVRAGDLILLAPGASIPVDGVVVSGNSFVDQARITGESLPQEKVAGSSVFAGTIVQSGALEVRTERVGRDTSFGKIVEAVESAERSRAPVERLADRLAGYLVYFALGSAALTYLIRHDIVATISVVIVAGACGIAAGTPLAMLGGIGRAARAGAIVKGGRYLEALAEIDTVVFDKTGTLTWGLPEVVALAPAPGVTEEDLLGAAAVAERRSEHPLGAAICRLADERGLPQLEPDDFYYVPGRGINARSGRSAIAVGSERHLAGSGVALAERPPDGLARVFVARDGATLGSIALADRVRPEAQRAVAALVARGLRVVLLTGDSAPVAEAVARELGFGAEVLAELLPAQKAAIVREFVAKGRKVAMVGDGVNDAPALVAATVGIAMGSGTDVARESADVVLLGNDLERLVETIAIARRAKAIVMQNFTGTLLVDAAGIGFAAAGLLHPLAAAFVHVASELLFILNSTRLLPWGAGAPKTAP